MGEVPPLRRPRPTWGRSVAALPQPPAGPAFPALGPLPPLGGVPRFARQPPTLCRLTTPLGHLRQFSTDFLQR